MRVECLDTLVGVTILVDVASGLPGGGVMKYLPFAPSFNLSACTKACSISTECNSRSFAAAVETMSLEIEVPGLG
jgi:hypothetical protein